MTAENLVTEYARTIKTQSRTINDLNRRILELRRENRRVTEQLVAMTWKFRQKHSELMDLHHSLLDLPDDMP